MAALSVNNPDVLSVQFRKIFADKFNAVPNKIDLFLGIKSSDRAYEDFSEISNFGDIEQFQGKLNEINNQEGYDTRFDHKEYGNKFVIERKLLKDDQYNVYSRMPGKLGLAAARTRQKDAQKMYSDGFTVAMSSTSGGGTGDGLSLFNASHTSRVGGVAVQSNAGSTALSATSIAATRLLMRKYRGPEGELIVSQPDTIIVPPDLEETAWNAVSTKGQVGSVNNDRNFSYGKYNVIVGDYLTDSNDWFMVDSMMMKENAFWFNREPVQFMKDKDFDTLQLNFAVYWRHSRGWIDWRWAYGHSVS